MRLRNMLKICLVCCKFEPQYAYKRYAYKEKQVPPEKLGCLKNLLAVGNQR